MPREKKEPQAIFKVLLCWNCNDFHEFKRSSSHRSKLKPEHQRYSNLLYGWMASTESKMCPAGGAYLEAFDPDEELIRAKGRGAKK